MYIFLICTFIIFAAVMADYFGLGYFIHIGRRHKARRRNPLDRKISEIFRELEKCVYELQHHETFTKLEETTVRTKTLLGKLRDISRQYGIEYDFNLEDIEEVINGIQALLHDHEHEPDLIKQIHQQATVLA